MDLSPELLALLRQPSRCFIATTMPDGSPQLTQVWGDTDGEHILVNTVSTHQKVRNIERDRRVAFTVSDSGDSARYVGVRGEVTDITTDGADAHIEELAQRYTGRPYPWYGGRDQIRVILTIRADHLHAMG